MDANCIVRYNFSILILFRPIQALCKTGLVAKIPERHLLFPYNEAGVHYIEEKKGFLLISKEKKKKKF